MDEDIEIYGDSHSEERTDKEIIILNCSAILALICALYTIYLLIFATNLEAVSVVLKHTARAALLLSVSVWCRSFAGYKNCIKYGEFNYYSEYNMMKSISFVTGILCLVRIATLAFYFIHTGASDMSYALYVGSEMLLLLGMACFFFYFASDMKKKIKEISTRKEE